MNQQTITKTSSKSIKLLDFLNDNKMPYIVHNLKKPYQEKAIVKDIPFGWKNMSYDKLMEYNTPRLNENKPKYWNAICVDCNNSNIVVVDIESLIIPSCLFIFL